VPRETPQQVREEEARLRSLSLEERGRMIQAACRSAALIYRSRLKAGLPEVKPAPWPTSTLEFLRQHAPNAKR
jgi:hypothetical protein